MIPDDVIRRRIVIAETGVEIALQDYGGDGPLALLHHANGFCAGLWAPVAESLRDRYRVVAMDARGAGDSSSPDLQTEADAYAWAAMVRDVEGVALALLAETGRSQIALGLGHSFGGTLVMAAEGMRPGLFGRIVAVDPVLLPQPDAKTPVGPSPGAMLAERARRRRHVWPSREAARAHFADRELFRSWTARSLDLYVAEGLRDRSDGQVELKCSPLAEAGVFSGSGDFDIRGVLENLRTPVLLLYATRGSFPRSVYERFVETLADARIEDVCAGHLVPMEDPGLVLDAIERFCPAV